MGLAALRKLLEPTPVTLDAFRGRTLAVDADNVLWSFVTAFGARGGQPEKDGRPVGHTLGLANRLKLYASLGARSAWVYDGEQPALKAATLEERATRIAETGSVALTDAQLAESKELLTALGIPWLVAPAESDAQCAHFVRTGAAWAAVTQDYDIALHACPRAGRNVTGSDTRSPELLELDASLARAGLTHAQLVDVAILVGTDYNDGVPGVGPGKAVKLVKLHGDLHGALAALRVAMPEADEVRALFHDHPVDRDATLRWSASDASKAAEIFARDGLSEGRAKALCESLSALHAARQVKL